LHYGHGTDNPFDEAVYLVLGALGIPFDSDDSILDAELEDSKVQSVHDLIRRRIREHIPVAYLINEAWFCGLSFYIDERVLVPRSPLAELIEEKFSPWMPAVDIPRILDIGTGSACIAIACAHAFPDALIDAVDIDSGALAVAGINVERYGMADRIRLIRSDLYEKLGDARYDLIVANPPYVGREELTMLPEEYSHEPVTGLYAGKEGLDVVERILQQSGSHMNKNGILVVEVGNGQDAVARNFPHLPFIWLDFERGGEGVFLLTSRDLA